MPKDNVTIFQRVDGMKFEKFAALHPAVQLRLSKKAMEMEDYAKLRMAAHHHSGASYITVEAGKVDRYLILNDERGQRAAMSIEKGRRPGGETGSMIGLDVIMGTAKEFIL